MKNGIRKLTTALTLLAMASSAAHAHGTERHEATKAPVIQEQTSWGIAGDPAQASRTLEVVMTDDMRFTPGAVTVREGETLRLIKPGDKVLVTIDHVDGAYTVLSLEPLR